MARYPTPQSVFLLDGLGAVVSLVSLGVVLPAFQAYIGMPLPVLYVLAALAACFASYSLSCYKFADHTQARWLKIVMAANLSYCLISVFCVALYFQQLTKLGLAYFISEKFVVLAIVGIEYKVFKTLTTPDSFS